MRAGYHHGNLRAALIAAALKELAREGLAGLTLRAVARRAGVSAPAVYRHFEDKDHLVAALAQECADRLAAEVEAAVARAPADPLEQFRARGVAIVRFAATFPEHFRALTIPGFDERAPPDARARAAAAMAAERESLRVAQTHGLVVDLPLDDVMLAASATVTGLAHAIVDGQLGDVDADRAERLATAVTAVLGAGLIPRDPPRARKRRGC